jgi:hypothetical protein
VKVNGKSSQDLKGLLLADQFRRSASSTLNYMGVGCDDVLRNEESAPNAQRLAIRVVHRQENN